LAERVYSDLPVRGFLDELASGAPVPGGGAGAALAGATGAALVSMVCNLTIGREKFAAVEPAMRDALARSEKLRGKLLDLLQADTRVYARVMAAYKLPRATADEKSARTAAIQVALKEACDVPQQLARVLHDLLAVIPEVAANGNVSAVSDAGVGAVLAFAALESAALNVRINLGSIKDAQFVATSSDELDRLTTAAKALRDSTVKIVESKIGA
jgi:formiminotetrahydrofolate cyclodeaminase